MPSKLKPLFKVKLKKPCKLRPEIKRKAEQAIAEALSDHYAKILLKKVFEGRSYGNQT